MMNKSLLISIIVPAYNAEKTLGTCVESILAQHYSDFELILIDDGSTDRTAAICDDYAAKDPRVKVIHKRNAGVGAARNSGLDIAEGEFITFIDSDDSVKVGYLGNLLEAFSDGIDLTISNETVTRGGQCVKRFYVPVVATGRQFDEIFERNYIYTSPWAKMYRASVLKAFGLRFPVDMNIGEDAVFLFSYMAVSDGVCVTRFSDYLYNNDVFSGGLTQKRYSLDKELYISSCINEVIDKLVETRDIHSVNALHNLNTVKSLYYERILDALYFSGNLPRSKRLEIMRAVDISVLRVFDLDSGVRSWLLSHLLQKRQFRTYDFIRKMAKIRRK